VQCWPRRAPLRRGLDGGGKLNVTTTSVHRPNGEGEELEEAPAELWVNYRLRSCGGE